MTLASLKEQYEAGFTTTVIAERTGIPASTVRNRLLAAGVTMRPPGTGQPERLSQERLDETVRLYREYGRSGAAQRLGISPDTVRWRLCLAGEPRTNRMAPACPAVPDGFLLLDDAAVERGYHPNYLRQLCVDGKVAGARRESVWPRRWLVPAGGSRR